MDDLGGGGGDEGGGGKLIYDLLPCRNAENLVNRWRL